MITSLDELCIGLFRTARKIPRGLFLPLLGRVPSFSILRKLGIRNVGE